MSHRVVKPFFAQEAQRVVQAGEAIKPDSEGRARDLERGGLIAPMGEGEPSKPLVNIPKPPQVEIQPIGSRAGEDVVRGAHSDRAPGRKG
jgi:hypothetical protein